MYKLVFERDISSYPKSQIVDDFVHLRICLLYTWQTIAALSTLLIIGGFTFLISNVAAWVLQLDGVVGAIVAIVFNETVTMNDEVSAGSVTASCFFFGSDGSCVPGGDTVIYTPILRN